MIKNCNYGNYLNWYKSGIKPSRKFHQLFKSIEKDFTPDQKETKFDNIRNCKCYSIDQIQPLNKLNDKHSLSLSSFKRHRGQINFLLNIDQLNYNNHAPINQLLDSFSCHMFFPHILKPTRVTSNSKILFDSIFSNIPFPEFVLGNFTAAVPKDLPQFVIASNIFSNSPLGNKSNIYESDWNNFDKRKIYSCLFSRKLK